jgi:hypothetical protein
MPSANTLSFSLSIIVAAIAVYAAISPNSQWLLSTKKYQTYCYDDVKTLSAGLPSASCFSVSESGHILQVYRDLVDAPNDHIKSDGAVIPGLWDGHGHILQLGEFLQAVNLFESPSMNDSLDRIAQYLRNNTDIGSSHSWIRGTGWDQAVFGRMPTAVCGT